MKAGRSAEVARVFLTLGLTAFGGPAAHIAMMHEQVVRRRRWLDDRQFLDLLGATNLIPGPNSTEMAIHVGFLRAGWVGLVVAGACFILPAMLIVIVLAWAYVHYGTTPRAEWLLYAIKPVVIAVIVQALLKLGREAVEGPLTAVVGATVLLLYVLGVHEIVLLVGGGLVVMMGANLRADFVVRLGWLSDQQVMAAVTVGQVTPGPLFTTATFIGFVLGGMPGALLATLGIFLPSFVFVALSNPLIPRLRRSPWAGGFLNGVNVASLALMAAVTWQLGRAALTDPLTVALALVSLGLLSRFAINATWLMAGAAAIGLGLAGLQ